MNTTGIPPERSNRGISATDVDRVADELLRTGIRPTVLKIRDRLGTGSPNTINPMLDAWWKRLASRLDAGPHALHRIPEAVAQITETLWLTALEEARARAGQEQKLKSAALERDQRSADLRRHVLSLREAEFEDRLRERNRTIAALEEQVAALTRLLATEQATRTSVERRAAETRALLRTANARYLSHFSRHATPDSSGGARKDQRHMTAPAAALRKSRSAGRKTSRDPRVRVPLQRKTSALPADTAARVKIKARERFSRR